MRTDPVLGLLKPHPQLSGSLLATIAFDGRDIELRIEPDELDMESCLGVARDLVASLKVLEAKARTVAADKLLEEYNRSWRMFSRAQPDGSFEEVVDPALTAAEFAQRLQFDSVAVTGSMIEFCFGDDRLFAGHSVFVTSFDGTAFTNTDATLFG